MRGRLPRAPRLRGALLGLALGGCGLLAALWSREAPRQAPASDARADAAPAFLGHAPSAHSSSATAPAAAAAPRLAAWPAERRAQLQQPARRWRPRRSSATAAAAAGEGTGAEDGTWLDCDLRFLGAEARLQEIERLEQEMNKAAGAQEFAKAQALKIQIQLLLAAGDPVAPPPETWLLESSQFPAFGRFLSSRGVQPKDVEIGCEPVPDGAGTWGQRTCKECVKLNYGGTYGKVGVVSPAYPPQEQAAGCLGLSSTLDVDMEEYQGLGDGVLGDEAFDGSEVPSSTAFCRAV